MEKNQYINLLENLNKNIRKENHNGLDILIKSVPDSNEEGVLDYRVYLERSKPKKAVIDEENYMYESMPIGAMRKSMGWPNIDISNDVTVEYKKINGVNVRVYYPSSLSDNMKCMIFIHGGGFWGGDLDVVENPCKAIADKANTVVISVDYALAPEAPFPNGLEDCLSVLKYVYNNSSEFNIDKEKICVSGDSAGGNLASVLSIIDRDLKTMMIKYTVLIYPVVTLSNKETEYYKWDINNYKITKNKESVEKSINSIKNVMGTIKKLYLRNGEKDDLENVSPLLAESLSGLPKTLVITAEFDFLRVQGEAYAKRLIESGVETKCIRYNGMDHAFLDKCGYYPQAEDCINEIAKYIEVI